MFILNPDPYSLPCYRIGPFTTRDLSINNCLPDSDRIDDYFNERFSGRDFIYTENGRKAINIALDYYNLEKDDVVTILTTSGNYYISGCVTREIEKFCRWSRQIVPETRAIIVNHEFGYPYKGLSALKRYKLPIIEDCAGSFFSNDANRETGNTGDFTIFSFPKMFPVQVGGLLLSNIKGALPGRYQLDKASLRYIKNSMSRNILCKQEIIRKREENYNTLRYLFESIGFSERFKPEPETVPGVFMFKTEGSNVDLPELKKFFWSHGIHCSVFYGEEAFFIPVHQALNEHDMGYFLEVMKLFIFNNRNEVQ
jgi:hypothetical protein